MPSPTKAHLPAGRLADPSARTTAAPYTSTIVFLVRKGWPEGHPDWADLTKQGVSVITPNPKTSGGARWNYLAAWAYGLKRNGNGGETKAQGLRRRDLFKHVPVLDTGARGSTITFAQRHQGDVLIAWRSTTRSSRSREMSKDRSWRSIVPFDQHPGRADGGAGRCQRRQARHPRGWLRRTSGFLYSSEGQELAAKHYFRPRRLADRRPNTPTRFPKLDLVTDRPGFRRLEGKAQAKHFADGGTFDQIYKPGQ